MITTPNKEGEKVKSRRGIFNGKTVEGIFSQRKRRLNPRRLFISGQG
jgi:hypothetical protein